MHGPVMHAVDFTMEPVFRMNGGKDGAGFWGYHLQWFAGLVLVGAPIVWASDLFWRFVDQPCVALARWLDRRCIDGQERGSIANRVGPVFALVGLTVG